MGQERQPASGAQASVGHDVHPAAAGKDEFDELVHDVIDDVRGGAVAGVLEPPLVDAGSALVGVLDDEGVSTADGGVRPGLVDADRDPALRQMATEVVEGGLAPSGEQRVEMGRERGGELGERTVGAAADSAADPPLVLGGGGELRERGFDANDEQRGVVGGDRCGERVVDDPEPVVDTRVGIPWSSRSTQ